MDSSDETDAIPLSVEALAGIRELQVEQKLVQELCLTSGRETVQSKLLENDLSKFFPEDWQISQFWYDKETTRILVTEIQSLRMLYPFNARIACLSCPSVFRCIGPSNYVDLFEFDRRFEAFGSSYCFYDFQSPLQVPDTSLGAYSIVILDPPFLSEDCLEKMSLTVKKLATMDAKILLCTAQDLAEVAKKHLALEKSDFVPRHRSNGITLRSEFACFCNYKFRTPIG